VEENIAHTEFHVIEELCAVVRLVVEHNAHRQATDEMMVKLYV
jgi:hypothetical protein